MIDSFLYRSLIATTFLCISAGPLGCFIMWHRLAFLSETLSHGALMGIALALFLKLDPLWGVMTFSLLVAYFISLRHHSRQFGHFILPLISHGALGCGLLAMSLTEGPGMDIHSFLIGDIFILSIRDVGLIGLMSLLVVSGIIYGWRSLLRITISPEWALLEGIPVERWRLSLMVFLSVFVAIGIQVVGALLVSALLVIPPVIGRVVSHHPKAMIMGSTILSVLMGFLGISLSLVGNLPPAPSIVTVGVALFILVFTFKKISYFLLRNKKY